MKSTRCILSIILGLLAGWLPLGAVTVLKNLQVEYQTNPLGIDVSQPRFNWQMESDRYGACGQAYRLWVADSPEQLAAGRYIYDSGKVLSGESVGVVYQGKALQPGLGKNEVRMAYVLKKEDLAKALTVLSKALEAYPGRML